MAKSKNGGTRAYIRGRVGADVYSIGKNAAGKKQQIVRSLAESVANPQTVSQMRGRMIMSTVMQAVSAMSAIVDHSFDGLAAGQPNISEFIRRNYALVKADVAANPASGNKFGLNLYQEKGIKQGAWLISEGKAAALQGITVSGAAKTLTIDATSITTKQDLADALGIGENDYFTICFVTDEAFFGYLRFRLNAEKTLADDIAADNFASAFTFDGNVTPSISLDGNNLVVTLSDLSENFGIIVSRKETSGYIHNTVTLAEVSAPAYTADVALPTYPVGAQRFLNGGGDTAVSPVEPETPAFTGRITSLTINSQTLSEGGSLTVEQGMNNIAATLDSFQDGHTVQLVAGSNINVTGTSVSGVYSFMTIGTSSVVLKVDGETVQTWGTLVIEEGGSDQPDPD